MRRWGRDVGPVFMHGISNTLSGCVGSIQNYLVFVNSVLFVNTGGDSRLAGYMLAGATAGLWVAGPIVIGYVPVMVVGTLIAIWPERRLPQPARRQADTAVSAATPGDIA